ncbi:MAG TPA: mechanosensitive ion channel [Methanoculleus sp.]|nr:mechanosensitive ion channel [Methanoculleus sp.]
MVLTTLNETEGVIAELPFREFDSGMVLDILYIIVLAYVLVKVLSFAFRKIGDMAGSHRITATMLIPLLKIVIYASAIYFIIAAVLQPSLSQLVAFSGLFGAALGFGLKDIFADIIGGIVIAFERPYRIGDKISVLGTYGEVQDIGLRATRIVTPDDSLVSIPNYTIFKEATASGNAGKTEMMVVIDLFIDAESDAVAAMDILRDAAVTSKYVYISPGCPFTILLEDFPFYKRIRARAYVNDHRNEFEFHSEVTRRAWIALQREGIRPPRFPAHIPDMSRD